MKLSEEFKKELNECSSWKCWKYTSIPSLDQPVLIILNYRPSIESSPFSFAFNLKGENKCWISCDKVKEICGKSPNRHEDYVDFNHKTHKFYAYSVEAFKDTTFSNIAEFKKICNTLYTHIDQVEGR